MRHENIDGLDLFLTFQVDNYLEVSHSQVKFEKMDMLEAHITLLHAYRCVLYLIYKYDNIKIQLKIYRDLTVNRTLEIEHSRSKIISYKCI